MENSKKMRGILGVLVILMMLTAAGVSLGQSAGLDPIGDGNETLMKSPLIECADWQTVTACEYYEDDDERFGEECSDEPMCMDAAGSVEAAGHGAAPEGPATLAACYPISGTSGNDTLYVGSAYYWTGSYWYTWGELGYCLNGAFYLCTSWSSPSIVVRPQQGNDTAGTTYGGLRVCVANQYAIGGWQNLLSYIRTLSINIYGCQGNNTLYGTPNNDVLVGGSNPYSSDGDTLVGGDGNDKLCGDYVDTPGHPCYAGANCSTSDVNDRQGADYLFGGAGNDDSWGHGGKDTIFAAFMEYDPGANFVNGGPGDDTILDGPGASFLWGGDDDDTIWGGDGNDYISGCNGSDHVYGQGGWDHIREKYCAIVRGYNYIGIQTNDEKDWLYGYDDTSTIDTSGDDIEGFLGDDHIETGGGDSFVDGGSGSDHITVKGNEGDENWIYGDGSDPDDTGPDGQDTIRGGPGFDWIQGDGAGDHLYGGDGDDWIEGGDDGDHIWGEGGCDYLYGQDGHDSIHTGTDEAGTDDGCLDYNEVHGGEGDDYIWGAASRDHIWGDNGVECSKIYPFAGDDWICTGCEEGWPTGCGWPPENYEDEINGGNDVIVAYTVGSGPSAHLRSAWPADGTDQLCYMGDGSPVIYFDAYPVGDGDCCRCWYGAHCVFNNCDYIDDGPGGTECDCTAGGAFTCTCP